MCELKRGLGGNAANKLSGRFSHLYIKMPSLQTPKSLLRRSAVAEWSTQRPSLYHYINVEYITTVVQFQ